LLPAIELGVPKRSSRDARQRKPALACRDFGGDSSGGNPAAGEPSHLWSSPSLEDDGPSCRDLGRVAEELEPAGVDAGHWAEIAEQDGIRPDVDEPFELRAQTDQSGRSDVNDEYAVLDAIAVGLQARRHLHPTPVLADVVRDEVASDWFATHRVRMPM